MRWNFKSMRKGAAAAAVIVVAAAAATGCGVKTVSQETETAPPAETTQEETEPVRPSEPETGTISPLPSQEEEEEEKKGKRIILMTDIHYLSPSLTDGGEAFTRMVEHGDGKLVNYVEEITDAALDEVVNQEPDVLILAGDLTLEGEKESHKGLAKNCVRWKTPGFLWW